VGRFKYLWQAMRFVIQRAEQPLRAPQIRDAITDEKLWVRPHVGGGPTLQQIHKRVDSEKPDIFYKLLNKRISLATWRRGVDLRRSIKEQLTAEVVNAWNITWQAYLENEWAHQAEFARRIKRAHGHTNKAVAVDLLTRWTKGERHRREAHIHYLCTILRDSQADPEEQHAAQTELENLAHLTDWTHTFKY